MSDTLETNTDVTRPHRSYACWYSDTEDAAARLVAESMQYAPEERENFLRDAYRGAKVQLSNANGVIPISDTP